MTAVATQTKKSNARKLSTGDHWSRNSYGRIVAVHQDEIIVENDQGTRWAIDPPLFEAEFTTADQFTETKKVTRTEMVQKIVSSARVAMTIYFRKQADPKDLKAVVKTLLDGVGKGASVPNDRALGKLLKDATAGAERTMIGRHFGTTDEFGRIQFLDVEGASSGVGLKTVDPRTVEWAVIENVRYELK
jgi:hypothetical protein